MLKRRFGFKKTMLSLFLLMAVIFFISGCQPTSEVVDVESVTISSAGGATLIFSSSQSIKRTNRLY